MITIQSLRNVVEQRKGQRQQIRQDIRSTSASLDVAHSQLALHEQAREVIRAVGIATQKELEFHIADLASLALDAVFDDPYALSVEFVQRRNKTECDLTFTRGDLRVAPLSEAGGGAVNVAAFALRVASWSMQRPRTRALLMLDEPFERLKGQEANTRVLRMVREVSRKLGVQVLMVSDERISREDIVENCDRCFEVKKVKGRSQVEVIS